MKDKLNNNIIYKGIIRIAAALIMLMLSACSGNPEESTEQDPVANILEEQSESRLVDLEDVSLYDVLTGPEQPQGPSPEEIADSWIKDHAIYKEATYVDISHSDVSDVDIDKVIERLPNLERLIMVDCGLDNEGYAALQDRHPDIKIVWEIILSHWTIRTDSVAFSTYKTTDEEFYMDNDEAYYLKYCNELVALDLGHNYVSDLSFLEYMPDLKILILVDNVKYKEGETLRHLTDLSELQYVPKLRYLEIFANNVSDFSFMQYLTELEDLNISYNSVSSIEYMTNLPHLKRLWMENTYIPYSGYCTLCSLYPNAVIIYEGEGSVDQGWRYGQSYWAMRRMFRENIIDEYYRD